MNNADRVAYIGIMDVVRPVRMVYIGINEGLDLIQLLRRNVMLKVNIIDKNLGKLDPRVRGDDRVSLTLGKSEKVLWHVLEEMKPDTIFIDGAHEHPRVDYDIRTSLKLCPSAVVIGHDWNYPPVKEAALSAAQEYTSHKLHAIETTPDTSLVSGPWGGFFIFDPRE